MFDNIEDFIEKIPNFLELSSSQMIPYFVYYLNVECDTLANSKLIYDCFDYLKIRPYSNISSYLSKQATCKNPIFIKNNSGYSLTRIKKEGLSETILSMKSITPTNDLIDLTLLSSTPYYVKKMSEQMCGCYDVGLYDASLVMMRKLFETLIIECYEKYGFESEIQDKNENYYYFKELINSFLSSPHWTISRNLKKNIAKIKTYGDLSAHNRRFIATKKDIDDFKFELRQCLQEIVLLIGYQS